MSQNNQQNAISRRLDTLIRLWNKFSKKEKSKVCVWSVKEDEVEMIESFYQFEASEHGKTEDVFLKFTSPFKNNYSQYGISLTEEIDEHVKASEQDLKDVDIELGSWKAKTNKKSHVTPEDFLNKLLELKSKLDMEGHLVAYFSPKSNESISNWVEWLSDAVSKIPDNIKVMLIQVDSQPIFNKLIKKHGFKAEVLSPKLDMPAAFQELASQGDQKDPGTKFRQLYLGMMQAAGKPDIPLTKELAKKAFRITQKNNWLLMEATIHMVLGGVFLGAKKHKNGQKAYDNAILILNKALDEGETLAEQQIIMAYLSKGMSQFVQKEYKKAAETYELAGVSADKAKNDFLAMDSWRMAGNCHIKSSNIKAGESCLYKSLEAGKKLEEDVRLNSTLPYAGKDLYDLSNAAEREQIDKVMNDLIGENWLELAEPKNAKKRQMDHEKTLSQKV